MFEGNWHFRGRRRAMERDVTLLLLSGFDQQKSGPTPCTD